MSSYDFSDDSIDRDDITVYHTVNCEPTFIDIVTDDGSSSIVFSLTSTRRSVRHMNTIVFVDRSNGVKHHRQLNSY
jgi:uncharacterized protein YbcV (DUF1398 family)